MRVFLRADPDIIMVGEMRDKETAQTAIEASLTGHLGLTTLHTNSTSESIVRLLDMETDPFNFADSIVGILSQRLIRALCSSCKTPYVPEQLELDFFAAGYCREAVSDRSRSDPENEDVIKHIEECRQGFTQKASYTLYKAPVCLDCLDTGHRGRIGVHELLMSTPDVKKMILR